MSRRSSRNNALLLAALLLLASPAPADDAAAGSREPIVITADRMEAVKLDETVVFIGQVVLKKEGMTLNADHLSVHYDTPAKGIRDIEALGNVMVSSEGRVALSNQAVYFSKEEKIILTGDPRIIENENQLAGERITLFLREDRSLVEGGKVLIYQDKETGLAPEPRQGDSK